MKFQNSGSYHPFNLFFIGSFSVVCLICLGFKLNLSQSINPNINIVSGLDILRTEIGIYLLFVLALVFYLRRNVHKPKAEYLVFLFACLSFLFYILKLTGIYAYTRDATPFSAIEYASYMLRLDIFNPSSAFFHYSVFIPLLLTIAWIRIILSTAFTHKARLKLQFLLALLIGLSFIPPLQTNLNKSIAYNPYIFALLSSYNQTPLVDLTQHEASPTENNQEKTAILDASLQKSELKQDIVLIILESVRLDAILTSTKTESLSPQREVTPNLLRLQNASIQFEHAYAFIPHTSKALVALLCGQAPFLSEFLYSSVIEPRKNCLTHEFGPDVKTVFFQSPTETFENRRTLIKQIGFQEFYGLEDLPKDQYESVNYFAYEDDIMLAPSKKWLQENILADSQKHYFTTYLTGVSHHNYHTPSTFKKQNFHIRPKVKRYLNSVAYVDAFVGKLIQQYKDLGLYDNTIFVIVSDHGEGFGEHRPLYHNNNIYNEGVRVPLLIHHKDLQPQRINEHISQLDLKEIIKHFSDKEIQQAQDSLSIQQEPILMSCWYSNYCYALIKNVNGDRYKYIKNLVDESKYLFHLGEDPIEQVNLIEENFELALAMEKELIEVLKNEAQQQSSYLYQHLKNRNALLQAQEESHSKFISLE